MTSFALFMLRGVAMNATEAMVLAKMNAGTFKVCPDTRTVSYYHLHRKRWYVKKHQFHNRSGRARVVFNGGHVIYLNRLVWIWMNRKLPVEVIDHRDGNRHNDEPGNLQPQTWDESNRQGGLASQAARRYQTFADDIPE